ncbi:hypothetical protein RKD41_000016 [Streptomyces tendae]
MTVSIGEGSGAGGGPPDIATMRSTAALILGPDDGPDAFPPCVADLEILERTLRGQLGLLVPEVQEAAGPRPKDVQTYCALACVGEARGKLTAAAGDTAASRVRHVRRLARVLLALCEHYERLTTDGETVEQTALRRLGEHSSTCATCRTRDDQESADIPCADADRLYDAWRRTRRGTFARAGWQTPAPGSGTIAAAPAPVGGSRHHLPPAPHPTCIVDSDSERGCRLFLVDFLARENGGKWGAADEGATIYCELALPGVAQ